MLLCARHFDERAHRFNAAGGDQVLHVMVIGHQTLFAPGGDFDTRPQIGWITKDLPTEAEARVGWAPAHGAPGPSGRDRGASPPDAHRACLPGTAVRGDGRAGVVVTATGAE